jgi:hypothetical protein
VEVTEHAGANLNRRGSQIYLLVWLFLGIALGGVISLASETPLANACCSRFP